MAKPAIAALLGLLIASPAPAATFYYTGPLLSRTSGTGFTRVQVKFKVQGPILANTTYSTNSFSNYNDGVNRMPAISNYLAKGLSYGGRYDSFMWGTVTTDAHAQPASWTFKIEVFFTDALGNEGYDLYVNGPGNQQTCPIATCGYDSISTTLPETLQVQRSFTSNTFGKLTVINN